MNPLARLNSWLPPERGIRRLVAGSFVDSLGTGLFLAGSALFFSRVLGLSTVQIGAGLSLGGLAGVLGIVPIGRLADRVGGRRAIVGLYLFRGGCFAVYPFAHQPAVFYVVAFLIGAAEFGGGPITQSLVGAMVTDEDRVRTMGVNATVRNAGFAIGAVLATAAVATQSKTVFAALVFADAATFFGTAALLARLPSAPPRRAPGAAQPATDQAGKARVLTPRFLALATINGVLFTHTALLSVGLPLWIVDHTDAPVFVVGTVVVINTLLAITLQVPLGGRLETVRAAASRQRLSGVCLAVTCLLAAAAAHTGAVGASLVMAVAAATLTLGEIWQMAGGWRLAFALAPPHRRASYVAVYEIGPSAATAAGPILLTWAVLRNGTAGWLGLAALFALAAVAVVLVARGIDEPSGEKPSDGEPVIAAAPDDGTKTETEVAAVPGGL
jgi:MFS family permease